MSGVFCSNSSHHSSFSFLFFHGQDLLWELSLPELLRLQDSWPTPRLSSPQALRASASLRDYLCTLFCWWPLSPTLSPCPGFSSNSGGDFPHQFFQDTSVLMCFLFLLLMYHSWTNTSYFFWSGSRCIAWEICLRTLVSSSSCQVIQPVAFPSWSRLECILCFKGNRLLFNYLCSRSFERMTLRLCFCVYAWYEDLKGLLASTCLK